MREHGRPPAATEPPPPDKRWTPEDYCLSAIDSLTSDELQQKARELIEKARRQLTQAERLGDDMRKLAVRLDARHR